MIRYDLTCRAEGCGAAFDSWFSSSADFDRLEARGLVSCPACGSAAVGRALMAPSVSRGGVGQSRPADMREALRAARRAIEAKGEDVGGRFAEEARRIHRGEAPDRLVYGEATDAEWRELREEEVPVGRVPWVPLDDA